MRPPPPASTSCKRQAQGEQAVLHLDELHPHARLHPCARIHARAERHGGQRVCRWHDRDGHERRQAAEGARRPAASPTTRSLSSRPTTARTNFPGRTRRPRRSATRRTRTGKAPSACPALSAGRARSRPAKSQPRSSPGSIGSRRCSPPPATRREGPPAQRLAARGQHTRSRTISTATTSSTT